MVREDVLCSRSTAQLHSLEDLIIIPTEIPLILISHDEILVYLMSYGLSDIFWQ